jgi:hypothetical protein
MNAVLAVIGLIVVALCFIGFAIGSIVLSIEAKRGRKTESKDGISGRSYSDYDIY